MCANYEGPKPEHKVEIDRKVRQEMLGFVPRERVRPTDSAPIIVPVEDRLDYREQRWGFRVDWDDAPHFNARCETITKLRTFKPYTGNRCLIPARSFIEGGPTFYRPGRDVFFFAGLWRDNGEHGLRFTMLTCEPNITVAPHKTRMPFILPDELLLEWLCGDWEKVLTTPDHSPLEKLEKVVPPKRTKRNDDQPRLF